MDMLNFVVFVLAGMITLPIIVTVGVYYLLKYMYQNPLKAFHKSLNWTTMLYILAVNIQLSYLFAKNFIGYILLLLLFLLIILTLVQWKRELEVDMAKIGRLLWRITFLIFFFLYVVFGVYGIVVKIIA